MKKTLPTLVLLVLSLIGIKAYPNAYMSGNISTDIALTWKAGGPVVNASVKNAAGNSSLPDLVFLAAPTISGFTPTAMGAGGTVTISGKNFTGATAVTFGGTPATSFKVVSSTSITAVLGAGASGNVQVITSGGTATAAGFTFVPPPTITSFDPAAGARNSTLNVYGTNFTNITGVYIGGIETFYTVISPTQLKLSPGILDTENPPMSGVIYVSTLGGYAESASDFTYIPAPAITSFTPSTGSPGDTVTITGSDFTGLSFVAFGNVPAASFTLISPTTIKAIVGSGETGKIHVIANGGSGYSATNFNHTTGASITSFSPKIGTDGDIVTITGTNFTSATAVSIGAVNSHFKVQSPTTILATVYGGSSGKISVNAGRGYVYSADDFTYISPITITSFSPKTGVPGDKVTIIGTGFGQVYGVNFGGVPAASYTNPSFGYKPTSTPDTIVATLGQGASGKITLTTYAALVTITSATDFTFSQAPAITSFTPATAAQGDTITITGTNFTGATYVMFGTAPAASFTVTSPTSISATVGSGAAGKITVTTPNGTTSSATKLTFLPPPTFSPFYNPSGGRDSRISLFGHHLSGTTHVYIGGVEINIIKVTAELIIAGGNMVKSGDITVTTPGGTGLAGYFTYIPAPSITSFSPIKAAQGDMVTITGINFTDATNVTFGGVPAASFTVTSPTGISATVGPGATGKIAVTTPLGTATSATDLTFLPPPVITSFTPAAAGQGATVTINGSNLKNLTAVSFGGVPSTTFRVLSATTITAIVANSATSGNVEVTTTGGKATLSGFTFLPKPVITSFSPTRAGSGDVVTITGTNFSDVTAVKFNNVVPAQSFTVLSSTSIIATVGAGASGNVNVITTGGPASKTGFFYIQPPTITSFSPAKAAQGDVVTITGTNFLDVTAVSIGGIAPTSFTRLSPTSITARVGSGASGKITTTSRGGTAASVTDFIFLPTPDITSFTSLKAGLTEKHNDISDNVIAYPNPFINSLALNLGNKVVKKIKVDILNYFGRVVYSKEFTAQAGEVILDLSNLAASQTYILKLSADNTQYINKIAKK